MINRHKISSQNRNNWFIDALLFCSGFLASISGVYFLFLPINGYQGGRNVFYGINILFTRHTWENIHEWTGIIMIFIAVIHFVFHWKWVLTMIKRLTKEILGKVSPMNHKGRSNLAINFVLAFSFLLTAISGLYFFFSPAGSHGNVSTVQGWIFTNATWDFIHTWASIVMLSAAVLHFAIHWRWVLKVTQKITKTGYYSLVDQLFN